MDVKYIPSDWDKMKDGIGDLIGLGRWGKGMIDTLKDLSDNLEDAESDIANHDSDGVISFHHTSQKDRYQGLYEDFEILHSFTGKVGDIVDRTIDQPFYEDMDAFVEAMRDLSISNYTTTNRLGVTETQFVYGGYGTAQSFEVPKTEVSLDDLFSGDNFYAGQMKLEYDAWKELNPDQDLSQVEYQQAALNTRAFEYESIRNQQEDKEFWGQIGALVVIVGATIICPPAGLALGAAYGAMELSSAVSGKDWISGRELGTGERWFRGLLAPLDIVPGVSGLTKFSSTVRLAHLGENIGGIGLRTGVKQSFSQGMNHIDNMVRTAGQQSVTRLKSASAAIKDGTNVVKNKLAKDTLEAGRLVDSTLAQAKNMLPSEKRLLATSTGEKSYISAENEQTVENKLRDIISRIEGINLKDIYSKKVEETWANLFKDIDFTNLDDKGLKNLIQDINKSDLTPKEKVLANIDAYNKAIDAGVKTDVQVISSTNFIDSNTGKVKWPEAEGYVVNSEGNPIKELVSPKVGYTMDRYGSPYGTYTSPFGVKGYSYEERALPYIENPVAYHRYEILRDFSELKETIETWPDQGLVEELFMDAKAYGYDVENFSTFAGEIAPVFDAPGGGIQWKLPISIEYLEQFGFIKEIK